MPAVADFLFVQRSSVVNCSAGDIFSGESCSVDAGGAAEVTGGAGEAGAVSDILGVGDANAGNSSVAKSKVLDVAAVIGFLSARR